MGKIAEIISKLLAGGVLRDVTGLLDEVITNKEERQILLNELKKHEFQHIETIEAIKARIYEKEMEHLNVQLQTEVELRKEATKLVATTNTSEHASWLSKNINSLIALVITISCLTLYFLVLTGKLKATEPTVLLVVSNATNALVIVLGFYFGSSVGSKLKDKQNFNQPVKEQ